MEDVFIHETALVSPSAEIGEGTRIYHWSQVHPDVVIGKNCLIGHSSYIHSGARIGNNVKFNSYNAVWPGVVIEDDVFVGACVVFTNDRHPRVGRPCPRDETLVKKGVSIGANATIVAPVVLGEYCMVGAGAVVTKDVPANMLVVGCPAKFAGWVCNCGDVYKGTRQIAYFVCEGCGRRVNIYHDYAE